MMELYYDMYGSKSNDLESVKNQVELALGITLDKRDSGYLGEYYHFDFGDKEEITCQENKDQYDGEPLEREFEMYPILIHVDGTARPEEFEKLLKASKMKFDLLQREKI